MPLAGRESIVIRSYSLSHRRRATARVLFTAVAAGPVLLAVGILPSSTRAADLYWDTYGTTLGSGSAAPAGAWDATLNWNDQADGGDGGGLAVISGWVADSNAVFAAGGDATGAYTVTVNGTQSASGMKVEEGAVTLSGGQLTLTN